MTTPTEPDRTAARRVTTAAAAATVVTVLSLAVGLLLTWWAASHGRPDTWEGLGYALFGTALTLVVYLVVAPVSAVVAFRRALPPGQRWGPVLGFTVVAWLLPVLGYRSSFGALTMAGCVAAMVAVPLSAAGRLRWRWTLAILVFMVGASLTGR